MIFGIILLSLDLSGLITGAWLPKGLARTLSHLDNKMAHPFARVATAQRYLSSPQDRPGQEYAPRRSLYQVVSPASTRNFTLHASARQKEASPTEVKTLD
jgi:hypothetical protein